jgi:methionine biosynthesis protein MetW
MTQALQATQRPDRVVSEILRVGRTGIVTFPNFGHWRVRLALALGRMPATPALPDTWYGTANIHLCTVADFEDLCRERGWAVRRRSLMDHSRRDEGALRLMPNLLAEVALYMLEPPARKA